jgi:hypothetical protein
MAIVPNLAFIGDPTFPVDPPMHTPNRIIAVNPIGVITPLFSGEIVLDSTTTKLAYRAMSLLNTSWVQMVIDNNI